MSIILFVDRVLTKISLEWRKAVFKKKAEICGGWFTIYGKIYHSNPNVCIGENVRIYPGVQFWGDGLIKIGNHVSIGNNTLIYALKNAGVEIGDNTHIAAQTYIIDMNHGTKKDILIKDQENECEKVKIGSDVWIAANVTILKGADIGDGAVIGAKALVNKHIPENAIAVGIPAKVIKFREEETT